MKSLIDKLKRNVAIFKASMRHSLDTAKGLNMMFPCKEFQGYHVYRDNNLVLMATGLYSYEPSAICIEMNSAFGGTFYGIIVNNAALDMPEHLLNAICAHEVGHIVNGDMDYLSKLGWKSIFYKMFNPKKFNKMERDADSYAVSMGYDIYEALVYISRFNADVEKILIKQGRLLPS